MVGGLTAATRYTAEAISAALGGLPTVKSKTVFEDSTIAIYEVTHGGQRAYWIYEGKDGRVSSVDIFDPSAATLTGVRLGMSWREIYANGLRPRCKAGIEQDAGRVFCSVPGLTRLTYGFKVDWSGPDYALPAPEVLAQGTLERMSWRATD